VSIVNLQPRLSSAELAFNPNVAALPRYNAGMALAVARKISNRDDIARLASNENPFGCSPKVMDALASTAFEPWRYADPACAALRAALAAKLGIDPETIVIGNGSEEMIAAISRAFLVPGAAAVTVSPSFGLHEIEPLAAGARVVKVPMTAAFDFDLAALEMALADEPSVMFLSSPWNPVGSALDRLGLERLIAATGPGTLFVLDEAYFEFTNPDCPDGLAVLQSSAKPFVVLRTLSKAYGLAGLRVGYAVCSDPEIARVVAAAKTPFNVNGAAQIAALAALEDEAWMRNAVARICAERDRAAAGIQKLGLRAAPSQTNFLFIDTGLNSASAAAALLAAGIIVKPWREVGFDTFVRVTIGRPDENDRFLAALSALVAR
jgi:histidinol-phosphate aminotransferase